MNFPKQGDELGLKKSEDCGLQEFLGEWLATGAKLAGALDGIAQDRGTADPAFVLTCLERALNHLHKSQTGLEAVAPKKLLPEKMVAEARKELFDIC